MDDSPHNQHIMISYNWDHQKEVLRIKQALDERGYQIWFDLDKMAGDIYESMAEAVQGASVVLLCVTEAYKKSENGMREAKFAADQKKKIIPLKLEKGVQFDDWVGPITAGKLWFDFSDERNFRKMVNNLEKELAFAGVKKRNKDETSHEWKVTVLGTQESGAEPGQFNWPNGLAWHGDELLVCDTDNHRIQIFDKNNVVSFIQFDGQFQNPFRPVTVAVTPESHLVIADVGNRQIIICDMDRHIIQIITRNADKNVDNINYMAGFVYGIE
ncbi:protein lin-41-like [Ptychodera flava]|uniref:protein lin-41-like n=1 Tax=Ptychodera flava TaxID=63121 RepID=UPI003969E4DD